MDIRRTRADRGDERGESGPYLRGRERIDQIRARAAYRRGEDPEPYGHGGGGPYRGGDPRLLERPLPVRHAWDEGERPDGPRGAYGLAAREIMTTEVFEILPDATLLAAAELMRRENVGALPVVDAERHLVGMVTDRDLVVRGLGEGRDLAGTTVGEVMTKRPSAVDVEAPVGEIVDQMARHRVRRVPIVDRLGRVVGIVSLDDLAHRADLDEELQMLLSRTAGRRSFWRGDAWR